MSSDCLKSSDKKYAIRPSPPYPANACCGKVIQGNDGRMYISVANKKGVCAWKLAPAGAKPASPVKPKESVKPKKVPQPNPEKPPKVVKPKPKSKKEESKALDWLPMIGHIEKKKKAEQKLMVLSVVPKLIHAPERGLNTIFYVHDDIVEKTLVKWFKERMEFLAKYCKCRLMGTWAADGRIFFLVDAARAYAVDLDDLFNSLEDMDDDGNYPVTVAKRKFLVSGDQPIWCELKRV